MLTSCCLEWVSWATLSLSLVIKKQISDSLFSGSLQSQQTYMSIHTNISVEKQQHKLEFTMIMMSIPFIPTLSQEIGIHGLEEFWKRGITLVPFGLAPWRLCHAHLHGIGIMFSKFSMTQKLWEESETEHFTNQLTKRLLTPFPPPTPPTHTP